MKYLIPMATALSLAFAGTAVAEEEKVVNVYNWSDYIDEEIIKDFEAETGIKVVYDVFDSNEILETKLLAGGTGYDVVVPSAEFMARQIQAGVFQELDKSKLENLPHLWDVVSGVVADKYDPGNKYSINYLWGTTGIAYNKAKIEQRMPDAPVDSWDMIFDPEVIARFQDCGIYILDAPTEVFPAALKYLGLDPDSQDVNDIRQAGELLRKIRPYIQKFHSSEYINALANGDICLALGWSGDVLQARDRANEAGDKVQVVYVIPKEGAQTWFDQLVIPSDAPHPENAHKFIDYLMRPEVIARASNYVYFANGNKASQEFLAEEVVQDTAIYPDEATMEKLYAKRPYPPKVQRVVTREWTAVKTGN